MTLKNPKLTLVLDVDEVFRRIIPTIREIYQESYGVDVPEHKITQWSLPKSFPQIKNNENFFRDNAERIFYESNVEEQGKEVLDSLYSRHEIVIATSQFKGLEHLTKDWFKKHDLKYDFMHFSFDKSKHKGDLMFDDGTHNLLASSCSVKVCMNKPWNQDFEGYRVYSLPSFQDFVFKLENKKDLFEFYSGDVYSK